MTQNPYLLSEHGLSLYIETETKKILFDAGKTDIFADNAKKLGIDLQEVDLMILSHGHYDHGGGISRFLKENDHAKIYMQREAFGNFYAERNEYIGIDTTLKLSDRIVYTEDYLQLEEGLELCTCNEKKKKYPVESHGMHTLSPEGKELDQFFHEQYLIITEGDKKTVISGCSHKGILNIMSWLKPDVIVGGFHFYPLDVNGAGKEKLDLSIQELLEYETMYYTCHCTGSTQYQYLKGYMGSRIEYIATGAQI